MTRFRWIAATVATALVVLLVAVLASSRAFCDGYAPGWVENHGGCAEWNEIERLYPWHWGVADQCLGVCIETAD